MKKIILILGSFCFLAAPLSAQYGESEQPVPVQKFKPRYAGTSVDAGVMFMPGFGSAFYVAPKISFQATPRLFLNAGAGMMQVGLLPSQNMFDSSSSIQRTATSAYIFAEGVYLLNERWSVNGSVMKEVSPAPVRRMNPNCMPSEAGYFGVEYKVTPSITVGARVGYSKGRSTGLYDPFYPY